VQKCRQVTDKHTDNFLLGAHIKKEKIMKLVKLLLLLLGSVLILSAYTLVEKDSTFILDPLGCYGRTTWATENALNPQMVYCKFWNGFDTNQSPRELKYASVDGALGDRAIMDQREFIQIPKSLSSICSCVPLKYIEY
jgi:hypothetical protein